ncbi:MAG: ABC transporter permease [Bacteroidetes bacterium GWE2_29_8]|nr:MAG: ABC transporter permease [Bacteroidetes bacterium GWE2_29_8]OFY18364.1 MAG: ABC transporter permease [Bacteroidetes bacterium GWF2_29_10]
MGLLIGSITIGLLLSFLALGVFISFRIYNIADITAEGSLTFGAAVTGTLLIAGTNPILATMAAFAAGFLAGTITGIIHTKFKINSLLAGILVMTALYSINLHVMGKSNLPLMDVKTIITNFENIGIAIFGNSSLIDILGWEVALKDLYVLILSLTLITIIALALFHFFKTEYGTAMRATGNNPQMIRALGVSTETMIIVGIGISNGFIALSGSLLAQYQGFVDVQMGIGMVVWGLASVIIGEALISKFSLGYLIAGAIMGAVLFRLLVAIALRWGINPNDLKLITALFVFIALVLPKIIKKFKTPKYA